MFKKILVNESYKEKVREAAKKIDKVGKDDLSITKSDKKLYKYYLKNPWLFKKNIIKDLPDAKPFFDLAAGPRMLSLRFTNLDKSLGSIAKRTFSFKKVYIMGHTPAMADPYIGSISFVPERLNVVRRRQYDNILASTSTGSKNNKIGLTFSWLEGSLPFNLFKPKKIYSENFEYIKSPWSGEVIIRLKDWRKLTPKFAYTLYWTLGLLVVTSGALVPIILNIVG